MAEVVSLTNDVIVPEVSEPVGVVVDSAIEEIAATVDDVDEGVEWLRSNQEALLAQGSQILAKIDGLESRMTQQEALNLPAMVTALHDRLLVAAVPLTPNQESVVEEPIPVLLPSADAVDLLEVETSPAAESPRPRRRFL